MIKCLQWNGNKNIHFIIGQWFGRGRSIVLGRTLQKSITSPIDTIPYLYTVIAYRTMWAPRWSIEFTGDTPFHFHSDAIDFSIFIEGCTKFLFAILIGGSCIYWLKIKREHIKMHFYSLRERSWYLPFGITPGSINVANVKLANTKNVMTPWYAGTHGWLFK